MSGLELEACWIRASDRTLVEVGTLNEGVVWVYYAQELVLHYLRKVWFIIGYSSWVALLLSFLTFCFLCFWMGLP